MHRNPNRVKFISIVVFIAMIIPLGFFAAFLLYGLSFQESSPWRNTIIITSSFCFVVAGLPLLLSTENKIRVLLVYYSLAGTLFASNVAIDIYKSVKRAEWREEIKLRSVKMTSESKLDVILRLRKDGINAYPYVFPLHFQSVYMNQKEKTILPLSGISNSTIVAHQEGNSEWMVIKNDRFGFNNPDSAYEESGDRVLVVGDSYAAGFTLPQGKGVAGVLRGKGYSAINMGYAGNGPLRELATLMEYGSFVKPKSIVWMWCDGNDFDNLGDEFKVPLLVKYLESDFSQGLINKQSDIDSIGKSFAENQIKKQRLLYHSPKLTKENTPKLTSIRWKINRFLQPSKFPVTMDNIITLFHIRDLFGLTGNVSHSKPLKPILQKAKKIASRLGAKLYFVYIPSSEYIDSGIPSPSHRTVLQIASGLNLPIIDLFQLFDQFEEPLDFYEGHLNERGYRFLAEALEVEMLRGSKPSVLGN